MYVQAIFTEGEGSIQLTSLYGLVWISSFVKASILITFVMKLATLLRRSIVLCLPFS
jgi:hypothetical protein